MLSQWLWIHVCYTEPNSCESCCVILSRLCFSYGVSCRAIGYERYEPMVVNYDVLWWTSDCESWCVMLSQWLWIMVCYAELVAVNHAVLYWSEWLWVMVCNAEPVVVKHGVLCWASGCEFMCAIVNRTVVNHVLYWADCDLVMVCHAEPLDMNDMSQWLWIMTCYGGPVVVNHGV